MCDNQVKLSISILCYNHEKFISRAIESVLRQKVNFSFEIIIGDDHSSDGSREIIKKYRELYPDKISLILHPRRYDEIPGRTNNMTNIYACRGQYIALLDGDDYWLSKDKLQKQVDFLDTNKDHVLAFHDSWLLSEEKKFDKYLFSSKFQYLNRDRSFSQEDLVKEWFVPTSTIVFRNNLFQEFPDWFRKVYSADFALLLLISEHGKIRYFKELYSVWRRNEKSFSSMIPLSSKKGIEMRLVERKIFRENFEKIRRSKSNAQFYLIHSNLYRRKGSFIPMVYYALKSFYYKPGYLMKLFNPIKRRL